MSQRTYYSEEARQRAQREKTLIVAVFLALGISIGTALAMLFAPRSGNETREEISEATDSAIKKLEARFRALREQMEERLTS